MKNVSVILCLLSLLNQPAFLQPHSTGILPKPPVSVNTFVPAATAISPMLVAERMKRNVLPVRGVCSIAPGSGYNDLMKSGNGKMRVDVYGDPLKEQIVFWRERIQVPWKAGFEAPKIAGVLPEVRKLIMAGKYRAGLELSLNAATAAGLPPETMNHAMIPAFTMRLDMPQGGPISNYLRTTNFENSEVKVLWTDSRGEFERKLFVSKPDSLVVQSISALKGKTITTSILLFNRRTQSVDVGGEDSLLRIEKKLSNNRFVVTGRFNPNTGNIGYAGVVRVVLNGGTATVKDGLLMIENAFSVTLLTRIEWYHDFQQEKVDRLIASLDKITPDYAALLARNAQAQSAMFDRASLSFNASPVEKAMSGEELLADQRYHIGYNPALLEKMFDMGRYWLMLESGDFPPIHGHLNVNVNLQVSGGVMENLPESMNAFFNWIEGVTPDAKTNAKNIFGARGTLFSVHPDQLTGVLYHYHYVWPHHYWISAGGWAYSPFWDHYLATNDTTFLRNRIMPGLRELGLFYEDYLSVKDSAGNYLFVPSYSPENWPSNTDEGHAYKDAAGDWVNSSVVINATMDIMVCREVLTHLIEGAQKLGTDTDKIPKWKALLALMPPYLLDSDGSIKEWAWPTLEDRHDHRHISQLYGVWPADEIDPDRTPELAKSSWLTNRKRAQGNASGHGISHRMLAAARLKDNYLVNFELKQLLEQGYIGPVLTSSHNPYTGFMPDQQGSIPTLLMEMLLYSREGVIEPLPAVPESLTKGNIRGILTRSFAKLDNMSWDLKAKTIDITLTSVKEQDISFIVRYGIKNITATNGALITKPKPDATTCIIHLPKNKPVTLHILLGNHQPSDWVLKVPMPVGD